MRKQNCLADYFAAILLDTGIEVICAVAAMFIKLDSQGSRFFVQERVGYRGRKFSVYKLRTMYVHMEGEHYTVDKDPRVTRVGEFLRNYRIDELPQIINILKGEMSWIGPRPEALLACAMV